MFEKKALLARKSLISKKLFLVFLFTAFSLTASRDRENVQNLSDEIQQASIYIPKVKTRLLKEKTLKNSILLTGELEPICMVDIKSKVQGRVESLCLKDGREASETVQVKKGEVLAVLDSADFKAGLDQAEASKTAAEIAVQMAKTVLKDKQRDKDRMENLYLKGAISLKQKELAVLEHNSCLERLKQAKANLQLAKAALQRAGLLYEEAFIKAPFDGVLIKRYVSLGDLAVPGAPIFRLQKADTLKLLINVPERSVAKIKPGLQAEVQVDALQGKTFISKIEKIYPVIDPLTRSATVELRLDNSQIRQPGAAENMISCREHTSSNCLFPGMFARARLILEKKEKALAVPNSCLLKGRFVYVFKDGTVHLKKIVPGLKENGLIEVVSGLKAGEEIVVVGQNKLSDGMKAEKFLDKK